MTKHGAVRWYDSEGVSGGYVPVTFDPALEYYAKTYLGFSVLQLIFIMLAFIGVGLVLFGFILGYLVGKYSSKPKCESQDMPEPELEPTAKATESSPPVDPQPTERGEPSAPPPPPPEPAERARSRVPPPPPPEVEHRGIFRGVYCSMPNKLYKTEQGEHFHISRDCQSGLRHAYYEVEGFTVCAHCMRKHGFTIYRQPADGGQSGSCGSNSARPSSNSARPSSRPQTPIRRPQTQAWWNGE